MRQNTDIKAIYGRKGLKNRIKSKDFEGLIEVALSMVQVALLQCGTGSRTDTSLGDWPFY